MQKKESRYSKVIGGLFLLGFVCMFFSSFNNLWISVPFIGKKFSFVASLLVIGAVVGLTLLIFNLLCKKIYEDIIIPSFVFYIWYAVDILIFVVVRVLIFAGVIAYDYQLGDIATRAMIGNNGGVYFDLNTVDRIYSSILSIFFKIFGNTFFALYFLQFLLSAIGYILCFLGVKKLLGRFSAAVCGLGMACIPLFVSSMAYANVFYLFVIIFGAFLMVLPQLNEVVKNNSSNHLFLFVAGIVTGFIFFYDAHALVLIILPVALILMHKTDYFSDRLLPAFINACGSFVGFFFPLIIDCVFISHVSLSDALDFMNQNRFSSNLTFNIAQYVNDYARLVVLVLVVMYITISMKLKNNKADMFIVAATVAMLQEIFFLDSTPECLFLILDICFMAMAGSGLKQMLSLDDKSAFEFEINDEYESEAETDVQEEPTFEPEPEVISEPVSFEQATFEPEPEAVSEPVAFEQATFEPEPEAISEPVAVEQPAFELKQESEPVIEISEVEEEYSGEDEVESMSKNYINENELADNLDFGDDNFTNWAPIEVENTNDNIEAFDEGTGLEVQWEPIEMISESEDAKLNNMSFESLFDEDIDKKNDEEERIEEEKIEYEFDMNTGEFVPVKKSSSLGGIAVSTDESSHENRIDHDDFEKVTEAVAPIAEVKEDEYEFDPVTGEFVLKTNSVQNIASFSSETEIVSDVDKDITVIEEISANAEDTPAFEEVVVDETDDVLEESIIDEPVVEEESIAEEETITLEETIAEEVSIAKEEPIIVEKPLSEDMLIIEEESIVEEETVIEEELTAEEEPPKDEYEFDPVNGEFVLKQNSIGAAITEEVSSTNGEKIDAVIESEPEVQSNIDTQDKKEEIKEKPIEDDGPKEYAIDPVTGRFILVSKKKPVVEKPVVEELPKEEPVAEEIVKEEPVAEEIVKDEPIAEEIVKDEPIAEELVHEEPVADENVHEEPVVEENVHEEPVVGENTNMEPVFEEPKSIETEEEETENEGESRALNQYFDWLKPGEEKPLEENKKEEIEFIENPLPLPKKHVHREMDYGRVIPSSMMHYDYDVKPGMDHYDYD